MAFVPAPNDFEKIKDRILSYLKLVDDTEADSQAADAMRSPLVRITVFPLKSFLATQDITLSSTVGTVSLPTDYNMAFSAHFVDSNGQRKGRLFYRAEELFDQLIPLNNQASVKPQFYTQRAGDTVFEFNSIPTSEVVTATPKVRFRYFKRLDVLVSSTDTFTIDPSVQEYIMWEARAQMAAIYDAKKNPLAQQMASRSLLDLVRRDTVRDEQDWY